MVSLPPETVGFVSRQGRTSCRRNVGAAFQPRLFLWPTMIAAGKPLPQSAAPTQYWDKRCHFWGDTTEAWQLSPIHTDPKIG
jgi:hypothetical protein